MHPTAEGHAAMADAALPAVREALGLEALPDRGNDAPAPPLDPSILQRQGETR